VRERDEVRFVTFPELGPKHGIRFTRVHINRLVEQGIFPAPVWLSPNRKAWIEAEILQYKASRSRSRPQVYAPSGRRAGSKVADGKVVPPEEAGDAAD
jgi:predicted DNA-binding transcriptional regulator AlpA